MPVEVSRGRPALEKSVPAQLFDSTHELWLLVVPSWLTCVVLFGYFSCKVYISLNLCDTLGYR
jgi:hypothetical protein